jgi:cysteinyl-tRNA synthetase
LEEKGFSPRAIRFLYLSAHYRQQQNFTLKALEQASSALEGIDQFVREMQEASGKKQVASSEKTKINKKDLNPTYHIPNTKYAPAFDAALADDLNIPQTLSVLFDFIKETNPRIVKGEVSSDEAQTILDWLRKINEVFGVLKFDFDEGIPEEVSKLVQERETARKDKDFAASDRLRGEIEKLGYTVKDTAVGQKVARLSSLR